MPAPCDLFKLSEPTPVSTLTVLLPYTELLTWYSNVWFDGLILAVINLDATNAVYVTFNTSEDATHADGSHAYNYTITPGTQESLEFDGIIPRKYFSIEASTAGPDYPTVNVQWCVRGVSRR
jgi:hypothetical protein